MDRSASGAVPGLPCCSNISLRCAVSARVLFLAFRPIPILARAASSPPERQSPNPLLPLSVRFPYMPALPLFRQCANPRTAVEMAERSTGATVEMAERSLFLFPSPPFLPLPLSPLSLSNIIRSAPSLTVGQTPNPCRDGRAVHGGNFRCRSWPSVLFQYSRSPLVRQSPNH